MYHSFAPLLNANIWLNGSAEFLLGMGVISKGDFSIQI